MGELGPGAGAWRRFGRAFAWQTTLGVKTKVVELRELKGAEFLLRTSPTGKQRLARGSGGGEGFRRSGRDAARGCLWWSQAFHESVRDELIAKAFGGAAGEKLSASTRFCGSRVRRNLCSRRCELTLRGFQGGAPEMEVIAAGKVQVVISPVDLTTGLAGRARGACGV